MTKRKWLLLVLIVLVVFGYIKLFYKTYSRDVVAKSADCIVMLDVKRITNTLIWNIITTPGQWKIGKLFSRSKKQVSWKDMVKIPDYVMAFHSKGQPANAWYLVLDIEDEKDFLLGVERYRFEKLKENDYALPNLGIRMKKNGNKLMIGTAALKDAKNFDQAYREVFVEKTYAADEMIRKAINAKSHLAIQVNAGRIMEGDGLITANFDKQSISINGEFAPRQQYLPEENNFSYSSAALYSAGFTQPTVATYALWNDSARKKASGKLNFNMDSFYLSSNKFYQLSIPAMIARTDSAISYTYDDDFNKIENVVVNKVNEPALDLTINGSNTGDIYDYFFREGLLEKTASGELFTPFPFVRSYAVQSPGQLNIRSANYPPQKNDVQSTCIFFQDILLSRVTPEMWKYTPDVLSKALANIESIKMKLTKKDRKVVFTCMVSKKKNDLPIFKM